MRNTNPFDDPNFDELEPEPDKFDNEPYPAQPNWDEAKKHLEQCESAYAAIGTAGYFALTYVIRPLRDRFNKGERTQELYDEIMEVTL